MADDEVYEEPVAKFEITCSLEPIKKKFFEHNIDAFRTELTSNSYRAFLAEYSYSNDYEGSPQFVVNNFLNGFVQQLEQERKYLFMGFRCVKDNFTYSIQSAWITNTKIPMSELIKDKYDYFIWRDLNLSLEDDMIRLLTVLSQEDDPRITNVYLH